MNIQNLNSEELKQLQSLLNKMNPNPTEKVYLDPVTPNKAFERLGVFFSQFHINNFWFTSSNNLSLTFFLTVGTIRDTIYCFHAP